MRILIIKHYLLIGIILICSHINGQDSVQLKVDSIDNYVSILEHQSDKDLYEINLDGIITSKHRKFLLFGKKNLKGGFAKTYLLKDSTLLQTWTGKRIFSDNKKTSSINRVERFCYKDNELIYFKSSKTHEDYLGMDYYNNVDQKDSLIIETIIYFDKQKVLKMYNKGQKCDKAEVLNYLDNIYIKHFNRIEYFIDN